MTGRPVELERVQRVLEGLRATAAPLPHVGQIQVDVRLTVPVPGAAVQVERRS
jgi:hypothetical protein